MFCQEPCDFLGCSNKFKNDNNKGVTECWGQCDPRLYTYRGLRINLTTPATYPEGHIPKKCRASAIFHLKLMQTFWDFIWHLKWKTDNSQANLLELIMLSKERWRGVSSPKLCCSGSSSFRGPWTINSALCNSVSFLGKWRRSYFRARLALKCHFS